MNTDESRAPRSHPVATATIWTRRLIIASALAVIGWDWAARAAKVSELQQSLDTRLAARAQTIRAEADADEKRLQAELAKLKADYARQEQDPEVLGGALARRMHEEEWRRRQAHEPGMARTPTERVLLEMEQAGADPRLSAEAALEKVATLASPPGSRIQVTKTGDQFTVRVAFRMAALSAAETGPATRHTTHAGMRAEIRQLSAQVARDLFAYCGSRGIADLSLTCNHTLSVALIPDGATAEEIAILRSRATNQQAKLYRVGLDGRTARQIRDWPRATESEVLDLLRVEYDGIDAIEISQTRVIDRSEAAEPLIF